MIAVDYSEERPAAINGFIDLREWDFEQQGTVKLVGDWEFYPNVQLSPAEDPATDLTIVHVPFKRNEETAIGTYRLQILLKPPDQFLGLRMKNNIARMVYVNQERFADQRVPYLFQSGEKITILIQVDRLFPGRASCMLPPMELGLPSQILNEQADSELRDMLITSFFILVGFGLMLLHVVLCKNSELISAGLLLLVSGLLMLVNTDFVMDRWLFELSFEWKAKLQEVMQTLMICFYLIFMIHILPKTKTTLFVMGAAGMIIIYALLSLLLRGPVMIKLELSAILLFILINFIFLLRIMFHSNIEPYGYLFFGIAFIILQSMEWIWVIAGWLDRDRMLFWGRWLALIFILLFILKRLYRIFLKQEHQLIHLKESEKIKNQFLSCISLELHAVDAISATMQESSAAREYAAATAGNDHPIAAHIMIVEDNPADSEYLAQLLSSDSYRITTMYTEEEVQAELNRMPNLNLMIISSALLTTDDYGLIRRLRTRYTLFELPVLIISSLDRSEKIIEAFHAGANDFMFKPLDAYDVRQRVRTLLQMQSTVFERIRLEKAVLRAKIEPHFLFNTLNTIASLSDVNIKQTRELLIEFGNFLRASFDTKNIDAFIPFHQELGLVQSYLFIEKMRHANRLHIEMDIEEGLHFMIPPLTLQPIVENAIRHGIMKKIEGGTIQIGAKVDQEFYLVSVKDNGIGMSEKSVRSILQGGKHRGIGLVSTDRRLKHYFGIGLSIRSEPNQGTEVLISIPKIKDNR